MGRKQKYARIIASVPAPMVERRPAHGAPCTHCGACCYASLCETAQVVFDRPPQPGPCPALRARGESFDDGFHCGLVVDPTKYSNAGTAEELRAAMLLLIGNGLGCDLKAYGEASNMTHFAKWELYDIEHAEALDAARKLWGLS